MNLNSSISCNDDGGMMLPEKNKHYSKDISRMTSLGFAIVPMMGETSSKLSNSILGFSLTKKSEYLSSKGGIYFSHRDRSEEKAKLIEFIHKDNKYIDKIYKKCILDGEDLLSFTKAVKCKDFKKTSDKELKRTTNKYFNKLFIMSGHLSYPLSIESYLEQNLMRKIKERISNQNNVSKYFHILTTPIKNNEYFIEQIKLLKIAILYRKHGKITNEVKDRINDHLVNFSQRGINKGIGNFWTFDEIASRVSDFPENKLKKELVKKEKMKSLEDAMVKKVFLKIKADVEIKKLSKWARVMSFIRTYRIETISDSFANMFPIFKEIGARSGLTLVEVINCTPDEIASMKFPKNEKIKKRSKEFLIKAEDGKIVYTLGKNAKKIEKKFISESASKADLNGTVAFKGIAKGIVRIILSNKQLFNIKLGEILVTSMTTPDFVPAMKKASAIVTDEGGMTCHAAIIAREMEKPCIIGTKFATKILKDGDVVEVDANLGIIKIL